MNSTPRYNVRITSHVEPQTGRETSVSYLTFRGRDEWCKRTAQKHAREYNERHGHTGAHAAVEEA